VAQVATDTARTTEKSYWGKTWEGETKQVKFKMLFEYSQWWGRGDWRAVVACSRCGLRLPEKVWLPIEVSQTDATIRSSEVDDQRWEGTSATR